MKTSQIITTAAALALATAAAGVAQSPQARGIGQAKAAAAATQSAGQSSQRPSPVTQRETAAPQKPGPSTAAPAGKAAPAKEGPRDPFVSPIKPPAAGESAPQLACPAGVRGIIVGQAELNGVARSANEMIAVITTTNTNRTYFLRQGAQLCNGTVTKITDDSIVFEENAIDPAGRPIKREVIKKIPAEAK